MHFFDPIEKIVELSGIVYCCHEPEYCLVSLGYHPGMGFLHIQPHLADDAGNILQETRAIPGYDPNADKPPRQILLVPFHVDNA